MESNLVALYQRHKVLWCVARQRAATELWVLTQKMFVWCAHIDVDIGEIAATTAGDANFLGHLLVMVNHQYLQTLLRRHACAK